MEYRCLTALFFALPWILLAQSQANEWRVGLAKVVITPEEPMWLSGYSSRTLPAQGKVHELWAKAAAFEHADGMRFVLITVDLGSVNPDMTGQVSAQVEKKFQLQRANLVLNCSHTHCAPEIAAERRLIHKISDEEEAKLVRYLAATNERLVQLVGAALADLKPAALSFSRSEAAFAFNRRNNPEGEVPQRRSAGTLVGPVDYEVPVMRVTDPATSKLRGILFGYACHNTTLNFQQYCGDYAGFAQYDLEAKYPDAVAMFVMGCGGDQNPSPRHGAMGLEYAQRHGRELSNAVEKALAGEQLPIHGPLLTAYDVVTLELEPLPAIEVLRAQAQGTSSIVERKAKYLLDIIDNGQKVPLTQACPLHVVRFGNDLLWIFISGETVLDYTLRCKTEFAGPFVWVTGYCDDVFSYLPSHRVLIEGRYEGRESVSHQLMATPFLPSVEEHVMGCISQLATKTRVP